MRRSPKPAVFLAFAALLVSGCPQPRGGRDAGAPAPPPDAGALDAGNLPPEDAGAVDPATVVRVTILGLRALLTDELPGELDPQSLFGVDLLDEAAIAARITELRGDPAPPIDAGTLADAGTPADAAVEGAPDADASDADSVDADVSEGDASDAAAPDAGAAAPEQGPDASVVDPMDGGLAPDAGEPADAGPDAQATLASLIAERDRLRLRFLMRPPEQRAAVVAAVRERRRLAVAERASQVDEQRARADVVRATAARDVALSAAAASDSAIERDLLAERARVETGRAELARWRARRAESRQRAARASAERLQHIHALELHLAGVEASEADERFDETVAHLERHRARFEEALLELNASDAEVPELTLELDLNARPYRTADGSEELLAAFSELEQARTSAVRDEARQRWEEVERMASDLRELDRLRVALLPRLSARRRDEVLGLGSEGVLQMRAEAEQARLLSTYWLRHGWREAPELPGRFGSLFLRAGSRNDLLWIGFWIAIVVLLWRNRESLTERIRRWLTSRTTDRTWLGLIRPFWSVVGPLLIPLTLVGLLHVVMGLLDDLSDSLAIDALRVVLLRLAWFWVLVSAISRLLVSRLRHGAGRANVARRILSSVRLVMGYGLVVLLLTDLSELIVGRGALYTLVVDVAWVGLFPIAFLLIHRWADEVCVAHRERYPDGFVARSLDRRDGALRRRLLTAFAAVQLAVAGTYSGLKELALRFEQSRRAFAFLFRRRLERRRESTVDETEIHKLPAELLAVFREEPPEAELAIDRFPELDEVTARLDGFEAGADGFTVALVGERGIGKTTWMQELARRAELDTEILDVPHRLIDPPSVCLWLSDALGLEPSRTVDEVTSQLLEGRRVILLDSCQNLVVRAIGGTVGLETLVEIAANTHAHVVWVCSFARYTWLYLERNRQAQNLFTTTVALTRWSEEEIAAMVEKRMSACAMEASFRDLVVERLRGNALDDAVLRTQEEYLRLLWDFSEGNPRIAIHYWLHSLDLKDGELRVRLFAAPEIEDLDALHEQSRFLLATIALHENATVEEAAASVGSPIRECAALLRFLESYRYVRPDAQGHWRITTHWYRSVVRYLRRRRMLFD